jgi:hypothetical protein
MSYRSFPQCYALLRRRGYSDFQAKWVIIWAQEGSRPDRRLIGSMRRCEVFERQQADYDLSRRSL